MENDEREHDDPQAPVALGEESQLYGLLDSLSKDLQGKFRMFNLHAELRLQLVAANIIPLLTQLRDVVLPISGPKRTKRRREQKQVAKRITKNTKEIRSPGRANHATRKMNEMKRTRRWLTDHSCILYYDDKLGGYGVKLAQAFRNEFAITRYEGSLYDKSVFAGCPSACVTHVLSTAVRNLVLNGLQDPVDALKLPYSCLGSFINHAAGSAKANCYVDVFEEQGKDPVCIIIARGDHPAGTVLLLDYGSYAYTEHHTQLPGGVCSGKH
jgi:hypothetical protein